MRTPPRFSRRRSPLPAGLFILSTAAAAAALAPSNAAAAPFTCEASVVSGTIATAPAIEPLVTGRGEACKTASVGLPNLSAPLGIVAVNALAGATSLTGDPARQDLQQAVAGTSIADIKIGSLGGLGLPLPLDQIPLPAQLQSITVPLPGASTLLGPLAPTVGLLLPGLTLPTEVTVDLAGAVRQLVALPTADLLNVKAAVTLAGASCLNGTAVTAGSGSLAGVSVLGNLIDANALAQGAPILDTQMIDLSKLKLSDLDIQIPVVSGLLPGLTAQVTQQLTTVIDATVAGALAALPPIALPIDLLRVQVSPGSQVKTVTSLTQNGPGIKISALGQPVVDLQLGQSKVGTAGVDCTPPKPPVVVEPTPEPVQATAASTALACTTRRLVLTDVVKKGKKVRLLGVADKRFAGQTVRIVFEADGKTAARAKVRSNGEFSTTARTPSKKLRSSNKARYRAQVGKEKSRNLKLERRLIVDKVRASNGRVRLIGRVTRPLGTPVQTITLTRRISCRRSEVVRRFKPDSKGRFSVLVKAPENATAQVYRFKTKVRKTRSNTKLFPTFTLPTGVDLT
ncbi:MAG: hypothetical protein H0V81_16130 [Solirubrobacterales bacterium]|nr:hypothetical protein [Solirubrobacterales bacterium]